ncbi:hypothetical protein D0962_17550 [Leptolyngbyaceae cyanobacterium CCMR0082]|uniref:Uncharacterized protein n=1 Tax=Adonisia turfae CCMR0082 TaxID=2304604 RepID=A0A6M0S986_9CYAN|nr:hypothetical protein [Adonisia turfae CCMR0082]
MLLLMVGRDGQPLCSFLQYYSSKNGNKVQSQLSRNSNDIQGLIPHNSHKDKLVSKIILTLFENLLLGLN